MRTREQIKQIVTEVLIDKLGVDESEINDGADLQNDLGMDSLDAIELIMEFEKEFGITIDDDDAVTIKTVGDITNYLLKNYTL